jgi:hypothetical protein
MTCWNFHGIFHTKKTAYNVQTHMALLFMTNTQYKEPTLLLTEFGEAPQKQN